MDCSRGGEARALTRWRWLALIGLVASVALVAAGGGGALVVIVPAWLIGLAIRYDNHTGSLLILAVMIAVVVLVMLGLVAFMALRR